MIAGAMVGWRNPARYIAPLALAAAITATYLIVHHALLNKHTVDHDDHAAHDDTVARHHGHRPAPSKAKFYIVKPGDTLSEIAAKTGVSIADDRVAEPASQPERPADRRSGSGCAGERAPVAAAAAASGGPAAAGRWSPAGAGDSRRSAAGRGPPRRRRRPPLAVSARAALIEPSSGEQLYGR